MARWIIVCVCVCVCNTYTMSLNEANTQARLANPDFDGLIMATVVCVLVTLVLMATWKVPYEVIPSAQTMPASERASVLAIKRVQYRVFRVIIMRVIRATTHIVLIRIVDLYVHSAFFFLEHILRIKIRQITTLANTSGWRPTPSSALLHGIRYVYGIFACASVVCAVTVVGPVRQYSPRCITEIVCTECANEHETYGHYHHNMLARTVEH